MSFDSVNDYVSIPISTSLKPPSITVAVWVKRNGWNQSWQRVIGQWTYSWHILRWGSGSYLAFQVYAGIEGAGGGRDTVYSSVSLADDTWYFVVGTYDATTSELSITVNGITNSKTHAYGGNLRHHWGSVPIAIGALEGTYWKGVIDEVCIYNRALSAEEIEQNYLWGFNVAPVADAGPDFVVAGADVTLDARG